MDSAQSATADGAGTATITWTTGTRLRRWTVSQVSTECPGAPIGATCDLRKNGSLITVMVANGDVSSGEPPVELQAADRLTLTWTGLTPGIAVSALAFYTETTV